MHYQVSVDGESTTTADQLKQGQIAVIVGASNYTGHRVLMIESYNKENNCNG